MRSGITHRWLRGSLFLTVLLVLLVMDILLRVTPLPKRRIQQSK